MASTLFLVMVFVFNLIPFAAAVAREQRTKLSCHDNESLALLQFKESLISDCGEFGYSSNYSKVSFWMSESNNCCKWRGIKCDENTGHVVSLDLSSSCLLGTINSNSSLFQLIHLQKLNLAGNDFTYSEIPTSFTHLSRLTSLNLSSSTFSGQIPLEILELFELISLDLSYNDLELPEFGLRNMAQNLPKLKELNLSSINILFEVPKTLTNLSFLTSLSLASCGLYGEFPIEIFNLPNLQSIDLKFNSNLNGSIPEFNQSNHLQTLELSYTSFFGKLPISIGNLKSLQHVGVIECNFFGPIPSSFKNLTQLLSLQISKNRFYGEFPTSIFHLPNLRELDVSFNENLTLHLPKFNKSCPLESLTIYGVSFSSKLQQSIGNLKFLSTFIAIGCNFSEPISSSLGNLTKLTTLDLEENNVHGSIPEVISKLVNLEYLYLCSNNSSGIIEFNLFLKLKNLHSLYLDDNNISIPSSLGNLPQLTSLYLQENNVHGSIPELISKLVNLKRLVLDSNNSSGIIEFNSFLKLKNLDFLILYDNNISITSSLGNLSQLTPLDMGGNSLHGSIPKLTSKLRNLYLLSNNFSGTVEFDLFLKLKNLRSLYLSNNNISLLTKPSMNTTFPKLKQLILRHCHLREFPDFLRYQGWLLKLDLSHNEIHGQVPKWMKNAITNTRETLDLSFNVLTGFYDFPIFSSSLRYLSLDSNKLQGPLPIPPPSIIWYSAPNNKLTGKIPHLICNLNLITGLDLSNNSLGGLLPQCLGNMSSGLVILNLHKNQFHGTIPQSFPKGNKLEMIDLSQNQLKGPIPRSLANCTNLKVLNFGYNQINDSFPFWLGGLSKLKILILRSNEFYGTIGNPNTHFDFSSLHVIDLSNNDITGQLPSQYFETWKAMEILNEMSLTYMEANTHYRYYSFSMTFFIKGNEMEYEKILDYLLAVDLSNNRFEGEIPKVVGHLKGLIVLNLSKNFLTGHIPSSLGNLTELESLDLSHNKLSGAIPLQLVQLNFLAFLSVSHNHLIGHIPSGKQFNTFSNTSFIDNLGLCGNPLSKKCENYEHLLLSPSTFGDNQNWRILFEFSWKVVAMGYGCGFVIGLVLGLQRSKIDLQLL